MPPHIILASTSPRRRQLLSLFDIKFKAVDSGYKEVLLKHLKPKELAVYLALGKANAAATKYPRSIIIAADTVVALKNLSLGKAENRVEAFKVLKSLSGKKHFVHSSLVILNAQTKTIFKAVESAEVQFKKLSDNEINTYLNLDEYKDRAASYAAQGKGFNLIKAIKGDISTVIGMPLKSLYKGLKQMGVRF